MVPESQTLITITGTQTDGIKGFSGFYQMKFCRIFNNSLVTLGNILGAFRNILISFARIRGTLVKALF
ncbi:MAG: hypothetical protein WAW61_17175, partial [Methylococcaceae bacterium]